MQHHRVWGRLNGEPFEVERSTKLTSSGKAGGSKLALAVGGVDLTQQEIA